MTTVEEAVRLLEDLRKIRLLEDLHKILADLSVAAARIAEHLDDEHGQRDGIPVIYAPEDVIAIRDTATDRIVGYRVQVRACETCHRIHPHRRPRDEDQP